MASTSLLIHDDLIDSNGNNTLTYKFCAPIFLTYSFGIFPEQNKNLLPKNDSLPKIRNGTLTFVEYKNQIYGLTCRHVTNILENENKKLREEYSSKYGIDESLIPQLFHFFIPQIYNQIHINSQFHPVSKDSLWDKCPDVSIARIKPEILKQIGRKPIPLGENNIESQNNSPGFCGIATGYPEQKRKTVESNNRLNTISIPCLTAYSSFASFTDTSLILFAELSEEPDADRLSGMSGGPILWSTGHSWGLAGIIKESLDLKSREQDSFMPSPGMLIEGERTRHEKIIEWIKELPKDEKYLPNLSRRIYIPPNYDPNT
jgi:hypothetical protein